MVAELSKKAKAWVVFDQIVALAAPGGIHTNPWLQKSDGQLSFEPDYKTLELLLGVPLHLKAETQSGVPALALDVWLSYELRRAGFASGRVWPRPTHPRIQPAVVEALIKSLPRDVQLTVTNHITRSASIPGVTSSSASILGKNYLKQVDVIITDWATGPELLVSTKRMDSSYGKNAPNRVEESYGDAKNLRLRHPQAALGFLLGLRSDILEKEPKVAEWLVDLLIKLGREDDAYHATCLVLMNYSDDVALHDPEVEEPASGILEPGLGPEERIFVPQPDAVDNQAIMALPRVKVERESIPVELAPSTFLGTMVKRVLSTTPVNMHKAARIRLSEASRPTGFG